MKNKFIFMLLALTLSLACEEVLDFDRINYGDVETGEAFEITRRSAKLSGLIKGLLREEDRIEEHGMIWSIAKGKLEAAIASANTLRSLSSNERLNLGPAETNGLFAEVHLQGLQSSQEYFFTAYAIIDGKVYAGEIKSFVTLAFVKVTITEIEEPYRDEVCITGRIEGLLPTDRVESVGFVWSPGSTLPQLGGLNTKDIIAPHNPNTNEFEAKISGLQQGVTYLLRAFLSINILNEDNIYMPEPEIYSGPLGFSYDPTFITVETGNFVLSSENPGSEAIIEGSLIIGLTSEDEVGEYGIKVLESQEFPGTALVSELFNTNLRELKQFTKYQAQAFAVINNDQILGDTIIFATTTNIDVNRMLEDVRVSGKNQIKVSGTLNGASPANPAREYGYLLSDSLHNIIELTFQDGKESPILFFNESIDSLNIQTKYTISGFAKIPIENMSQDTTIFSLPQEINTIDFNVYSDTKFLQDNQQELSTEITIEAGTHSNNDRFDLPINELRIVWTIDSGLASKDHTEYEGTVSVDLFNSNCGRVEIGRNSVINESKCTLSFPYPSNQDTIYVRVLAKSGADIIISPSQQLVLAE